MLMIASMISANSGPLSKSKKYQTSKSFFALEGLVDIYHDYCENLKCAQLRKELISRMRCRQDVAQRLIALAKRQNPGKSERWYLEKVIFDLKRGR